MMERLVERTLVAARWLLAPLYLGLALLLMLFIVQFFQDLWHATLGVLEASKAQLIIEALGMVDLALVASLIVMVMLSSYENYLSRLDIERVSAQLTWLAKLDAGSIKVKVAVAIVVISAIDLLSRGSTSSASPPSSPGLQSSTLDRSRSRLPSPSW